MLLNVLMTKTILTSWQKADAKRLSEIWYREKNARDISQKEFMDITGMGQSAVSQMLNGDIRLPLERLLDFARYLQRRPDEISPTLAKKLTGEHMTYRGAIDIDQVNNGSLPLLSSSEIGDLPSVLGLFPTWPGKTIPVRPLNASPSAFAVTVEGDQMASLRGDSFGEGMYIIVDPEQSDTVKPGDRVLAMIKHSKAVVFRELAEDSGNPVLKPLNTDYKIIFDEFDVIGKVILGYLPT